MASKRVEETTKDFTVNIAGVTLLLLLLLYNILKCILKS
jgi:hypothetical protein